MILPLVISLAAKIDVISISSWYDSQTHGTGERLLSALDHKFEFICEHPLIYPTLSGSEIRKCRLDQWPYPVFFVCDESLIEVIAVIHTCRDPKYVSSRIS
jgi:ParE toxin of type II toxin-antitoxin system, parDE